MARNGTVLIAGASTRHGRAYARAFAAGDYRVTELVERSTAKGPGVGLADAKAVRGALQDAVALVIALDGRGSEGHTWEERTTRTLIEAAASEHVAILYSSLLHADRQTGAAPLDVKGRLELVARRSGATATILRPALLMDVFDDPVLRRRVTDHGVLASAIGLDVPVSYLAADDLGLFGLLALEVPGLRGATLDLGGPLPVTFRDLIPQLWRMTGHSVTYEQHSPAEVSARSGDDEARLVRHINGDGYAVDMGSVLARLPVRLTTLGDHLAAQGWVAESWAAEHAAA
jgi:uncharacterized protein YbjT (DUF2867 family)